MIFDMITVNDFPYPFHSGMTIHDALQNAAVDIHGPVLVTCNGRFVSFDHYRETILVDGDVLVAMRVVSGG